MALLLICRRNLYAQAFNGSRPAAFPALYFSKPSILNSTARYIRTSGAGSETVYDTPQVRKNSASASLTLPQPQFEAVKESAKDENLSPSLRLSHIDNKSDVLKEKITVLLLTGLTKTYDLLTLPIYAAIQQPWKKLAEHKAIKAVMLEGRENEWRGTMPKSNIHVELEEYKIDTIDKLVALAIKKHGDRKCLGAREVRGVYEVEDDFGKPLKKYDLGEYKWLTYSEVGAEAEKLCRGLSALGLKPRDRIGVFAETRAEWLLTAMAAFKLNLQVCTVFATLGDDGVVHALNETEVSCLITSDDLMPRINDILKETPLIKNLVYMNRNSEPPCDLEALPRDIKVQPLTSLIALGGSLEAKEVESPPEPNDTAIIMYTSGSTGIPKGVVLSHWNLVSALEAITDQVVSVGEPNETDSYIGYLPLAHALELMSECMCLLHGIHIGYSSPMTMTDQSLGVKPGCKGDASLLKPTILTAVPLVLERILKGIHGKVSDKGQMTTTLFNFFYNYKVRWTSLGYETPLVDRVFFRPIRDLIGGQVRLVVCGGAPLAAQTHEFMRAVLGCPVLQGYGLTETSGNGSLSVGGDLSVGRVGGPLSCSRFRLVDWEEGGYRVTDKPNPRGEVYIGGDNVAMGYFKRTDCTDFFSEDGTRWFRTGDIAEAYPDGGFRIIDRKKDLVKLATGEYISLGKIEAILKTCPYVENICVYADTSYPYPVAVMVASQAKVEALAAKLGVSAPNFSQLTKDPVIVSAVLAEVQKTAAALKLQKWETPRKIYINPEIWMPQSGLVTAAFKIKRNNVYSKFRQELDAMLAESDTSALPLFQTN